MSSDSSSSRDSSPARFQSGSPASDAASVAPTSWQPSSSAFHPSASFQVPHSQPPNPPVLRQPVGFGSSPSSVPTYHAPLLTHHTSSPQQHHPAPTPQPEESPSTSRNKSSKAKEKEPSKKSAKASSSKGKQAAHGSSGQTAPLPYPTPVGSLQKTAFRVKSYSNDPTAVGTPYEPKDGPYGAAYRATVGEPKTKTKSSRSSKRKSQPAAPQPQTAAAPSVSQHYPPYQNIQQAPPPQHAHAHAHHYPPQPQSAQGSPSTQPRPSYYRYDYDKLRESAPAYRAQVTPVTSQPSAPPRPPPQQYQYSPTPQPPPPTEHYHRRPRSSERQNAHPYPTEHRYSPPSYHYYPEPSPSPPPPADYYQPPPHPPSTYPPPYPAHHPPQPTHSPEKPHKSKSRSHRHEQSQYSSPAPPPPAPPPAPAVSDIPPPAVRICRVLTLLIEDKRDHGGESMLAEVRVPLKQMDGGDEGFWADAQEVSEELQTGPSRIDGAAKVYTQRGKYKQYFLRISADGERVCQPANLKVAPDRTLEIFIEDNPPAGAAGKTADMRISSSPPRMQRELLTPVTESMASPSPAPAPPPPKRSSLFSVEDALSPREDKFDGSAYNASVALEASRKRPRSSSIQSIQSARSTGSDGYSVQQPLPPPPNQQHESVSPVTQMSASTPTGTASGPVSRTPSHTSPPHEDPAPTSPVSPAPDPPFSQKASTSELSGQPPKTSAFLSVQNPATPAPVPSESSFMPSPSPPKKAKLALPQPASPGPSQPVAAYPWSHSRTRSASNKAGRPAPKANPFAQYESGPFGGLGGRSASAGQSAASGIALPSIPSLSTVSAGGGFASFATAAASASQTTTPSSNGPPAPPSGTLAPTATALAPTLSGAATSALDNAVGLWIRGVISKEPQWDAFVRNRTRVLKMAEQLEQYRYVQRVLDQYAGRTTPADLEGAGGVTITKAQVMRAFNLPASWGEDCTETLVLTTLYGPGGTRGEDARVCAMLEETPPITTGMQAKKYLTLLREVHGQWTIAHPDGP